MSYPDDWNHRRTDVYKRDDYECQNCGRKGGRYGHAELHAHHIVPISEGGTHRMSNLKTLCSMCHKAIHNKNIKAPTYKGDFDTRFVNPIYKAIAGAIIVFPTVFIHPVVYGIALLVIFGAYKYETERNDW